MEPGSNIVPPKDCEEVLDILNQNKYQSGVGTLMYLLKNSRPDINNSVIELSKYMVRSSQEKMNILYRVMKYFLDTKDKGLFLKPKFENENKFVLLGFCDSDWGSNKYDRKIVSCWSIYFCNCLINWGSRTQSFVDSSSSVA